MPWETGVCRSVLRCLRCTAVPRVLAPDSQCSRRCCHITAKRLSNSEREASKVARSGVRPAAVPIGPVDKVDGGKDNHVIQSS